MEYSSSEFDHQGKIIPFLPLMAGGNNICEINAPSCFGSLKIPKRGIINCFDGIEILCHGLRLRHLMFVFSDS